ncbi:MAG TPA: alkaline phosphatase [Phycisphaerae bacterium]|nr:alkaline phosphatase [Phycisphaerae bacterium]HRR86558.1 alkaline phosphatase [Phycisphaerae bacterium]
MISPAGAASPKNVIFMIGDGMGFEHVKAGGMYLNGQPGTLCFESLPYRAQVTTYSADNSVTDSAAAGTAMATGHKVNNGVVSMAYPGDGRELQTLLELYKARGTRTGLVTSDAMTGATPAAFGAHEYNRDNRAQIAGDYLNQTRPNVLLGGGGNGITTSAASAAGYTVVTDRAGMQAVDTNLISFLSGQFGTAEYMPYEYDGLGNLPHLSQMIVTALDILDNEPNGFLLMVEGGNIDHAAHANHIARVVYEVVEFHNTVQIALNWAAGRTDTLILVTADHETGGLTVTQNNGQGNLPTVSWSSTGHTAAQVGAWAWGVNAQYVTGTLNNTAFFEIIAGPEPVMLLSPKDISRSVAWAHNPPPQTDSFTLSNARLGTYNYTITSDASWVWADPASGDCSTETDTIWLVYDVGLLLPGDYVAHLEIRSDEAINAPQILTVTLTVRPAPGDFNRDNDVDQEDFGYLQGCLTPVGASLPPECRNADLTSDGRVDASDIVVFRACLSGPDVQPDPYCAD